MLPRDRGYWNSVFKRYVRWSQRRVGGQLLEWQAEGTDLQDVSIDSTTVRAHACAAGAAESSASKDPLAGLGEAFVARFTPSPINQIPDRLYFLKFRQKCSGFRNKSAFP